MDKADNKYCWFKSWSKFKSASNNFETWACILVGIFYDHLQSYFMISVHGQQMSTSAILTVRLIRSFEHGNVRPIVIKDVQLEMSVADFQKWMLEHVKKQINLPPPVINYTYDTMKIQHKAHGAKTNDPIINTENDEQLILKLDKTLKESGIENETEISFFKMEDYKKYKEHATRD